ncbi:MAG: hypothetical protein CMN77_20780 [Spirochaetaceae bacterium]|nr:hypothetical protein [Spirochaetaceae bacterium]
MFLLRAPHFDRDFVPDTGHSRGRPGSKIVTEEEGAVRLYRSATGKEGGSVAIGNPFSGAGAKPDRSEKGTSAPKRGSIDTPRTSSG